MGRDNNSLAPRVAPRNQSVQEGTILVLSSQRVVSGQPQTKSLAPAAQITAAQRVSPASPPRREDARHLARAPGFLPADSPPPCAAAADTRFHGVGAALGMRRVARCRRRVIGCCRRVRGSAGYVGRVFLTLGRDRRSRALCLCGLDSADGQRGEGGKVRACMSWTMLGGEGHLDRELRGAVSPSSRRPLWGTTTHLSAARRRRVVTCPRVRPTLSKRRDSPRARS